MDLPGLRTDCPPALRVLSLVIVWAMVAPCWGFNSNGQWTSTASEPTTAGLGKPVTLTWSIVPDDTSTFGSLHSDLITDFDALIGGGTGTVEQRSWFSLLEQSFARWSEISGVNLVYEPNDDGTPMPNSLGELGVRGDIRIGGSFLDGNGGTYGSTGFIPSPHITLDTGDTARYSDSTDNYFGLRQTLTHEIGHALGLGHNQALGAFVLMHPFAQTAFDGPQLDDILGMHYLYGDAYERGLPDGNNQYASATDLGAIAVGASVAIGDDVPMVRGKIEPDADDFASISFAGDEDYYKFQLEDYSLVDLLLTPGGFLYQESVTGSNFVPIDTQAQNDLTLALYAADGDQTQLVDFANNTGLGGTEQLAAVLLAPGEYAVRVAGSSAAVQLYELAIDVALDPAITTVAGDFNEDGRVDLADYTVWRDALGTAGPLANAPGASATVDAADYAVWKANFGAMSLAPSTAPGERQSVPEPKSLMVLLLGMAAIRIVDGGGLFFSRSQFSRSRESGL
ncbi:matrixin family metalloprotease [Aeoliella mucimassa]|uniref:Matrixin n=1 Tax=Aeoliella mucimassa TaxID=2527972 RepID=A0A518AM71_9BACT|nr:matrixin family metalloprotease [Aeoliella mucimassa]QDU55825.1 Matrixin [Aeoliella mucimassa]